MAQTAIQFAKAELKAERFVNIGIYAFCGEYHFTDSEGALLKDRPMASVDIARTIRSRIIDRALKAHFA